MVQMLELITSPALLLHKPHPKSERALEMIDFVNP